MDTTYTVMTVETEDSIDDVFTSSTPSRTTSAFHRRHFTDRTESIEEDELLEGGSSYLPSHPEPLLPKEDPLVPPMPIRISDENYHRGNWGSKLEFLIVMVCQLTPFSIFSFPYTCFFNEGLIFMIPYIVVLFCFGFPTILLVISLGQFISTGFLTSWKFAPILKGLAFYIFFQTLGMLLHMNTLLAMTISSLYLSLSNHNNLPWATCNNSWNTENCRNLKTLITQNSSSQVMAVSLNTGFTDPGYEYSRHLDESGYISVAALIGAVVAFLLLLQSTLMGVKLIGKLCICTLVVSVLLTITLLVHSVMLEGSTTIYKYILQPDLTKLSNVKIWIAALDYVSQTLIFSLWPCVALSSHNRFYNNCFLDTVLLVICYIFAPCMFCIVMFSVWEFVSLTMDRQLPDIVEEGLDMIFATVPGYLSLLPSASVWCVIWFGLIALNIFSTQMGTCLSVISSILDLFGWVHSWKRIVMITLVLCLLLFAATIFGLYVGQDFIFTLKYGMMFSAPVPVVVLCISLTWLYGGLQKLNFLRFSKDVEAMVGFFPVFFKIIFTFMWAVGIPFILVTSFVYSVINYRLSSTHIFLHHTWILCGVSFLVLLAGFIIGAIHEVLKYRHLDTYFSNYLYRASIPLPQWGPTLDTHRKYAGYLPSDFTPQPYRMGQRLPMQESQNGPGSIEPEISKGEVDPGAATLPVTTPLLGLALCSKETTL